MTDLVASRASYLQEAAHLLAVSSPVAAAFLGSARDRLIEDAELEVLVKEWDSLRRESCGACGNLFVPGWSCTVSSSSSRNPQKKPGAATKAHDGGAPTSMVYHCLRCHRRTEQPLQHRPRRQLQRGKARATTQLPIITNKPLCQNEIKTPKTANASSKQRQKSRKGGLQAMLEKNKTQSSQQGLDLMDFMM